MTRTADPFPVSANHQLAPTTASAPLARRLARGALAGRCDTVRGVAELLVTNALLHSTGSPTLCIHADARGIRVSVHDQSPHTPEPRRATADDSDGRGLLLVDALADSWGWEPTPAGKLVWFELDSDPR